jgi:hypothetical protein
MWENDYEYLQNKLNYSMGIYPSILRNMMVIPYDTTLPNEHTLLTIRNIDRLAEKNPILEMIKTPYREDEYHIIYKENGVLMDPNTFEYKQFPLIKVILNRVPNSNGTYTVMGNQLISNNTVELKLRMEDIKNIDIFERKLMNLISNIANN